MEQLLAFGKVALAGADMLKRVIDRGGLITSLIPYADTVSKTIGYLQSAVELGKDIAPDAIEFIGTFSDPEVTPEKMAALKARIAVKEAKLDAPLPPKEDGEED